jgi:hypothetical protein
MAQFAAPLMLLQAGMQVKSGIEQKKMYAMQARQEQFAAREREIQRRRNLVEALASQNAAAAARGITPGGSVRTLMQADIGQFSRDQRVDQLGTAGKVSQIKQAGRNAMTSSLLSAASTVGGHYYGGAKRGGA